MLAYITGSVEQELLLRNEYLASENRILKNQIKGRLWLTDPERISLAEIGQRLGRETPLVWQLEHLAVCRRNKIPHRGESFVRDEQPALRALP